MRHKLIDVVDRAPVNFLKSRLTEDIKALRDKLATLTDPRRRVAIQESLLKLELALFDLDPNSTEEDLITKRLQISGFQGQIYEIGAGIPIANTISKMPGASRYFLGAGTPYKQEVRDNIIMQALSVNLDKLSSVCAEVSSLLANTAYRNSRHVNASPAYGLGITAATATDKERKGKDHFYLTFTADGLGEMTLHGEFLSNKRDIQQEIVKKIGLRLLDSQLAEKPLIISDLTKDINALVKINKQDEPNTLLSLGIEKNLKLLEDGHTNLLMFSPMQDGRLGSDTLADHLRGKKIIVVYKGSFDPITIGHLEIMRDAIKKAMSKYNCKREEVLPLFEISLERVGKDELPLIQTAHNAQMIGLEGLSVLVTKETKFYQLAEVLSTETNLPVEFVMGYDVYKKLKDPIFYEDLAGGMDEGLARFLQNKNGMLIAPRFDEGSGTWENLLTANPSERTLDVKIISRSSKERELLAEKKPPQYISPRGMQYIEAQGLYQPK